MWDFERYIAEVSLDFFESSVLPPLEVFEAIMTAFAHIAEND